MKLKPYKSVPALIALGVIAAVCLLRVLQPVFLERLEWMTFDMRAREALRFPPKVSTNLGFVFIDEESIKRVRDRSLGFHFGLYWPRQVYGRLVQELAAQGAKAVALDVLFGELRDDHPSVQMADGSLIEDDDYFALELRRAGNTIVATTADLIPPTLFLTNALALGDVSTDKDADGILRRARAFRIYRRWHPVFRQAEANPEYGLDLRQARVEPGRLVLPRSDGSTINVPLDRDGRFALADFIGGKLPPGMAPTARPFTEERVWQMGVVLAARELGLDLDQAEVDFPGGRITLRGPAGIERSLPVDAQGDFYIDWCLPPDARELARQSIQDVLLQNRKRLEDGQVQDSAPWRGKLVTVGSAAAVGNDLTDRGATPLRPDTLLVAKHWNVANSIINNRFVRRTPLAADLGLIILLGASSALLTWRLRVLRASALILACMAAYLVAAVALYVQSRLWIPLVLPLGGACLATHLCLVTWRVLFEQADKRHVRSIFSTIVSPKIVHELLQAETLSLGGARREITIFFADVRGFTEFTESGQEQAAETVRQNQLIGAEAEACFDDRARETLDTVNLYLGCVAETILRLDGTLDKFIGDCVMAFWGAPASHPRHATAAVRAAIEAQRAVYELNRQRAAENKQRQTENLARRAAGLPPRPLLPILVLGSGLNSGMATVGLMGAQTKAGVRQGNYTVFGREVNLASRLEGLSGRGRILISHATFEQLRRDESALAETCIALPPVGVKGIRAPVHVFEVPWHLPGWLPIEEDLRAEATAALSTPK